MPDPNYRALCAELLVFAEESISYRAQVNEAVRLIDRARAALAQPKPVALTDDPAPSGYAYRYPTMDGSVVRFNHGQEVNGCRPLYAIPYWLGQPPARPANEPVPVAEQPWEREGWCGYA